MTKLLIALLIGTTAGVIDLIPMVMQKLKKRYYVSAFVHWVVLGVLIAYIEMPVAPSLKGLIVAELSALPIVIIVANEGRRTVVPILAASAILGVLVGIATAAWAR